MLFDGRAYLGTPQIVLSAAIHDPGTALGLEGRHSIEIKSGPRD